MMMNHLLGLHHVLKLRSLVGMLFLLATFIGCNAPEKKEPIDIITLSSYTGPIDGGTLLIITGSNFEFIESVKFDEDECTNMVVVSETKITCTIPAHAAGAVTVTIQGRAKRTANANYTYVTTLPVITGFTPASSGLSGGNTLAIMGSGFLTGAVIDVGGTNCSGVAVTNPGYISCIIPAKAAGSYYITVTNPDGYSTTSITPLTYAVTPVVGNVSPSTSILAGGGTLTVNGSGFLGGAIIKVGSSTCTSPVLVSSTQMTCTLPSKVAGIYSVGVTNTNNKSGSLSNAFVYKAFPTIASVNPSIGVALAATPITITGTGFLSSPTVLINFVACTSVVVVDSTSITCTTPALAAGTYDVTIINGDGQFGTLVGGYSFRPPPTITSISPVAGAVAGLGTLTLTGTGFVSGATVTVGGTACASVAVIGSTSATCTIPAGTAGPAVDVILTNIDAQSVTLASAYTYQVAPVVTGVAPLVGPLAGGTTITVTGTGFIAGATVSVGGVNCSNVVVGSLTSLTCDTGAHAAGSVAVTVTNSDLQNGTQAAAFTYQVAPTVTGVSPSGGNMAGGTSVTVSGSGFLPGAAVNFGGSICTIVAVGPTSIDCTTTAHAAGAITATVTNTDTQAGTLATAYNYLDVPTITNVAPLVGALAGGTPVTITGTNFYAGATVALGGSACTGVVVNSATSISCTTGAHAAGSVAVDVTNIDSQVGSTAGAYLYRAAPTITGVSPTIGSIGGGTNITLTGTDFYAGATVNVGGNACASIVVVSPTSITCTTPFSIVSGAVGVSVTNTDTQVGNLATAFIYLLAPTITGVSPNAGPLAGGTTITITGTSFFNGATATVDGVACTSPVILSATSMTCVLPANAAGSYDVEVSNIDGQSVTSVGGYTYQIPPTVVSVSPASGALAGATGITVTGTGFVAGASVTVGGLPCTSVVVVSPTSVTCNTPANAAGSYGITVTNADAQNGSAAGLYTYQAAPVVTTVLPVSGPLAGGTLITITGTGFLNGAVVAVGGTPCAGVSVVGPTSITCSTPAKAAGAYAVLVTNIDAQAGSLNNAFTYQAAPTITSVTPNAGALAGGTTVTITGTGFLTGATVTVGGTTCTTPTVLSLTSMTCVLPARAAGAYTFAVTNTDTQVGTLAAAYTYQPAPTVGVATPNNGPVVGGTVITLTGTGFLAGATVSISGTSCTGVSVINPTSLTCTTQAKIAGSYAVTVTNADTQAGTTAAVFSYQAAPTVTGVTPNQGALAGGTPVTVTGAGFLVGATIDFGGSSCAGVTVVNATTITCTTSAHVAGAVTITATNTDLQTGNVASGYTYVPAPTVTSVAAVSGPQAGGTPVVITGTNFLNGAIANFGAAPCTGVNVVNATTITCTTPPNAAGAVAVSVLNADGQSGSAAAAFTYTAIPALEFQLGTVSPNPPDPDNFGSTTTNITHTYTVTNVGEGTSSAITISLTGTNPAAFFFGTDNCSGSTLAPATTCTVQLTFLGSFMSPGTFTAVLNATAASGGTDTNVVSGTRP